MGATVSWQVVDWAYANSPFKGATFTVHVAIAHKVNEEHGYEFFMSIGNLAEMTRLARSSVIVALAELVEQGYLVVLKRGGATGQTTRYLFRFASPTTGLGEGSPSPVVDVPSPTVDTASPTTGPKQKEQEDEPMAASSPTIGPAKAKPTPPPYFGDRDLLDSWLHNGVKKAV